MPINNDCQDNAEENWVNPRDMTREEILEHVGDKSEAEMWQEYADSEANNSK